MQFNFWKSGRKNSSPGGSVEWSLGLPMFIIPNAPSLPPLACLTGQDTPSWATFTQISSSLLLPMQCVWIFGKLCFAFLETGRAGFDIRAETKQPPISSSQPCYYRPRHHYHPLPASQLSTQTYPILANFKLTVGLYFQRQPKQIREGHQLISKAGAQITSQFLSNPVLSKSPLH